MNSDEKSKDQLPSDHGSALVDLIRVGEGAIVSRVLARTTGGNVTLFAFDGGQGLSEHTAPFDAIVQVVNGRLELTIGEVETSLGAGEVIRMPANVPHALHAAEPTRMVLTMLRELDSEA